MRVKKVSLTNFRNYDQISIPLQDKRNLLIGENAQGKTNFLEAIEFACNGKSSRAQHDLDLIRKGCDNLLVEVVFEARGQEETIAIAVNRNSNRAEKRTKINGLTSGSTKTLRGRLVTVAFKASDLNLVRGGPKDRRDWIDDIVSTMRPAHLELLSKYQKAVLQRNRLLKQLFEKGKVSVDDQDQLKVWDSQVAQIGASIIKGRLKILNELLPYAESHQEHISGHREALTAEYIFRAAEKEQSGLDENEDDQDQEEGEQVETRALNEQSEQDIARSLMRLMKARRWEEIARKQSLCGPHRDDIQFFLNGASAVEFASQGQQRSLVLSFKLAELERVQEMLTEPPVLLLDDVLAELDLNRQGLLMSLVKENMQTLITTTHITGFRAEWVEGALFLEVRNGSIVSINNTEAVI